MDIKNYLIEFYKQANGTVITPELATLLVKEMAVTDGSNRTDGEKWTIEECKAVGDSIGVDWSRILKAEWYLVLNMMYSDYYTVCQKFGLPEPQFFIELALSWFNDVDAKDCKTFNYFFD